jgi:hypothetical protein
MEPDVVEVKPLEGYTLWVRLEDGTTGTLSLEGKLDGPVFQPLKDKRMFDQVFVHPELHVVAWPNGADLAPEFVYEQVA